MPTTTTPRPVFTRAVPASRTGTRASTIRPTSIRGRILDLLSEEATIEALRQAPFCVADLALTLTPPEGKSASQWGKEIGSVLAVDMKEGKGLYLGGVRRATDTAGNPIPGRFTLRADLLGTADTVTHEDAASAEADADLEGVTA